MGTRRIEAVRWFAHVPQPLVGCWYLDDHSALEFGGRTDLGQLVYQSKTYEGKPGDREMAEELAGLMAAGAKVVLGKRQFPLANVDLVVSVPSHPPKEPFNLPDVLAARVAQALDCMWDPAVLVKEVPTPPAKDSDPRDVAERIPIPYRVARGLAGATVVIVDDLVHNGTTLAGLAQLLIDSGAIEVGA